MSEVGDHREVVKELTEAGLSTRAIAPVFGVTHKTIVKDIQATQVVPRVPPEPDLVVDPLTGEVIQSSSRASWTQVETWRNPPRAPIPSVASSPRPCGRAEALERWYGV